MASNLVSASPGDTCCPLASRSATSYEERIILHGNLQADDGTDLIGLSAASLLVTSLDFLDWRLRGTGDLMLTARSNFIGVISPAFGVTTNEDAIIPLRDVSVLVHELTIKKLSLAVNALALTGLFAASSTHYAVLL